MKNLNSIGKVAICTIAMTIIIQLCINAGAGSLDPIASPASTMHSLDEIYKKIEPAVPSDWSAMPDWSQITRASAIHMKVEGTNQGNIEGSCEVAGREDTIVVTGLAHNVYIPDGSSGSQSGSRVHEPLTILKYIDKATVKLYKALTEGEELSEVTLKFYIDNTPGGEIHFYTILLEKAYIKDMKAAFPNVESVTFVYEKITWTWEPNGIEHEDSVVVPR